MRSQEFYNGEFVRWLKKDLEIAIAMQPKITTNTFGIVLGWTQFFSFWYCFMFSATTWNYTIIISLLIKDYTFFFIFSLSCFSGETKLKIYFIKSQKLKFSKTPFVMAVPHSAEESDSSRQNFPVAPLKTGQAKFRKEFQILNWSSDFFLLSFNQL